MALRPKKRNEITTDEPARAGYQTPNLGAQFAFPYNSQRKLGSKAILDVPASLDPQAADQKAPVGMGSTIDSVDNLTHLSPRQWKPRRIREAWIAPALRSTERSQSVLAPIVWMVPNPALHADEYCRCSDHARPEVHYGCVAS